MPSSDQIASDSRPYSSRMRARQREGPGRVHAAAVGGQHADAPVADLVAEALDDDRAVAGHHARRRLLLAQVVEQVAGGQRVEVVVGLERGGVLLDGPAREGADGLAELARPADGVAAPERDGAGRARCGRDDHAVAGDLLDPPRRGAEQEDLARAGLVDHLLVELADAAAVGEVDGEQAAVGDRAGVGDRQRAGALARADACRPRGPTRCARAARRTPRSGSGRRACRARSRAARATARRRSTCG